MLKHVFLHPYHTRCLLAPVRLSNTIKLSALLFTMGQFLSAQGEETQQFSVGDGENAALPFREVCKWRSSCCIKHGRRLGFGIPSSAAAQQPVCRSFVFACSSYLPWDKTLWCWHMIHQKKPKNPQIVCWKIRIRQHLGESKWTVLLKIQQYAKILPEHCSDAVVSCHVFWPL